DVAHGLARAAPSADIAQLAWYATAIHAARAGGLLPEERGAVLHHARSRLGDPDQPLHRVAPAVLRGLGAVDEARTIARRELTALGESSADPYRARPEDRAV